MNYVIKHYDELTKDELYQIMMLRCEVFVVEQACPYQDIDGKDLDAYHLMLMDDELVGYLRILKPGVVYEYASIGRVLVRESHRRLKLGKGLMEEAIIIMKQMGYDTIKISAQAYLEKFYNDLGFQVCTEPYLEDDIPHIGMLNKLK